MEKHTLTKLQADLLGTPALAGVEVDVVVLEGSENCFPYFPDVPVARDVYYQGVRLGGGAICAYKMCRGMILWKRRGVLMFENAVAGWLTRFEEVIWLKIVR